MPDVVRLPWKFDCTGIDLVHPIDRMPDGSYPYLFNVRIIEEGRLDGRPGYSSLMSTALGDEPNSIRRLNDTARVYAPDGYTYVGGGGTKLYTGDPLGGYTAKDSGYSGNPLSLIPFRPDQSPESWMYVYDSAKMSKVRGDGLVVPIGIAPPVAAPTIDYGVPASVDVDTGQAVGSWTASGAATGPTLTDRTVSSTPTISSILYNSGSTGWACLSPVITNQSWLGDRMRVILNTGGGNQETVTVREIHPAIQSTTVAAIQYDSGTIGHCSLVLTNNVVGLARNSLITINAETVRVQEVLLSPDGTSYSLRCKTTTPHAAGEAVTGLISWYVYTAQTHAAAETISSSYLLMAQGAAGTGVAQLTSNINAGEANGRPITISDDYLHISVYLQNPAVVTTLQILVELDTNPSFSFTNPDNSLLFTLTTSELRAAGAAGTGWVELLLPISQAANFGTDPTRNLSTITGLALQVVSTAACDWGFDWWYLFGTYGPTIIPGSPTGYEYQYRYRDSTTGAVSVPGPLTRYDLFPLREAVVIQPRLTTQVVVNEIDVYRLGGTIPSPLYVGTVDTDAIPLSIIDGISDLAILEANQAPNLSAIQPWPLLDLPWQGTCTVIGSTVVWASGTPFKPSLLLDSAILINGIAYQTYGNPATPNQLYLTQNAGYLATANFAVPSPTLTGQPLPIAFGALEGPFAPVIFALGDKLNGGLLYYTNFSDADSASDQNTLELSAPGQDLVGGAVWNGMAFAGNQEKIFVVRYSYLTSIGATSNQNYQWNDIEAPSGIWSSWAVCSAPIGMVYLGRDGLYVATDRGAQSISDEKLYPLFPHEGQPAKAITIGDNVILPVDMTQAQYLRLSYCDNEVRFAYRDTGGNFNTLIYDLVHKGWFLNNYANAITTHYLVEGAPGNPDDLEVLMLSVDNSGINTAGGNTDGGGCHQLAGSPTGQRRRG